MSQVGFLLATSMGDWGPFKQAFEGALDNSHHVTYHPANGAKGKQTDIQTAANELANGTVPCDIIVTAGTGAAVACKTAQGSAANPKQLIFASVGDAALSGLAPTKGGNFTGCCNGQANKA